MNTAQRYLMYISENYAFAILRPLQTEILKQGGTVRWFVEGKHVNTDYFVQDERELADIDAVTAWQPEVVLVPGNIVPNFISGLKVALFHGFNAGKLNRRGREDHFEIRACFDLYCTQGPNTTDRFVKLALQHGFFSVAETGWPMTDPLFSPQPNNPYIDPDDPRKTVLMCSTFSQKLSCAPHLIDTISTLAKKGQWRFLIQFHPKMDRNIVKRYQQLQGKNLTFVETDDVIPLLQAADVMLCDTSSILLLFLLLRKPVVTFRNRTGNPSLINIENSDEVEQALAEALVQPGELLARIDAYCQELHPYRDGQSSQRVLAAINACLKGQARPVRTKPANLIRMFKIRKKLGYWKGIGNGERY